MGPEGFAPPTVRVRADCSAVELRTQGGGYGHGGIRTPDPLHVTQVELLRRHRAGDHDELVERGIQLTLNTIATGLRNSG